MLLEHTTDCLHISTGETTSKSEMGWNKSKPPATIIHLFDKGALRLVEV